MVLAGKLDRIITLLAPSKSRTEFGEEVETFGAYASVWAEVMPISADERFTAAADHSHRANTFRIRYRGDVTPTMRIDYDGVQWQVKGITENGRLEALEILAEVVY